MRALSLQDWDKIETELRLAAKKMGAEKFLMQLLAPLVGELGKMVAAGKLSISQEHVFSALLKERLYALRETKNRARGQDRFVVAAPEGDYHELGILIAHVLLVLSGRRTLYLGPNTPKRELGETALRYGATHVLVGSTLSRAEGAKEDLLTYLHFLDQNLSRGVHLWLGGRNSTLAPVAGGRAIRQFSSLEELQRSLAP